jgi:hypothetical protein
MQRSFCYIGLLIFFTHLVTTRQTGAGESVVPNDPHDAEHWLEKAEQARQVAATVKDPEAKRLLELVAENYQRLAEVARGGGKTN